MCAVLRAQPCWRMTTKCPPPLLLHIIHNPCLEEHGYSKVTIRLASRLMGRIGQDLLMEGNTGQLNLSLFLLFSFLF